MPDETIAAAGTDQGASVTEVNANGEPNSSPGTGRPKGRPKARPDGQRKPKAKAPGKPSKEVGKGGGKTVGKPTAVPAPAKSRLPRAKASNSPGESRAYRSAAAVIKQAADPTRLQVLSLLLDIEMNVTDICKSVGLTQPAVSHHLALLRHGRMIEPRRQGKNNYYSLTDEGRRLAGAVRGLIS